MASLTVSSSPSTTTNTITVQFTTDVLDISKVELSNDGGNTYINATSFTSSSAEFNVATWASGAYNNCVLRLTYTEITYTITNNLSNCTISNSNTSISGGSSYNATITANIGYAISSIVVTMGDTDISSSVVSDNSINISSVTGNITITASAIESRILSQLQYGKGWRNNSSSVVDNSQCWATVDAVSVTADKRYKIACDASWLWIRTFDENDALVATISTGSDANPSEYTFTPTTSYIRAGCYDPNKTLTYFTLEEV